MNRAGSYGRLRSAAIFVVVSGLAVGFTTLAFACTSNADCATNTLCVLGSCDHVTGACQFVVLPDGHPCDDGLVCTTGDRCLETRCVSFTPLDCGDGDPCTDDFCGPFSGCEHSPRDCTDGNSCTDDACDTSTGCLSAPNGTCDGNPKNRGYWKHLCQDPRATDFFTEMDVECVNDLCTFASVGSTNDICNRLDPEPSGDRCVLAEAQLLAAALNLCRARIASGDVARPSCGSDTTVGEALTATDALLCDPGRTQDNCGDLNCAASEISSGAALGANTLRVTRQGSSQVRLEWKPLYGPEGFAPARLYRVWRRTDPAGPFVQIGETSALHLTDNEAAEDSLRYEITIVR